jgi:AcrR family transcriptional regulator
VTIPQGDTTGCGNCFHRPPEARDRRTAVLMAGLSAFAERGYYGTPTTEVAKLASISQPYIFKLFPTKEQLFIEVIEYSTDRILACFRRAVAESVDASQTFKSLGQAFAQLAHGRDILMVQLHAQSACRESAIREAVRSSLRRQIEFVRAVTAGTDEEVRAFFSLGMLNHLNLAVGAQEVDEQWARTLVGQPGGAAAP